MNGEARVPIEKLLTKDSLTSPIMNLKETYIQLQELVAFYLVISMMRHLKYFHQW